MQMNPINLKPLDPTTTSGPHTLELQKICVPTDEAQF